MLATKCQNVTGQVMKQGFFFSLVFLGDFSFIDSVKV